ncbi:leucyl aminopeptidase [Nocardioides luteus]|uniref:Probable cytosol aminopeptidase n=1 Tax=Nocardioides luteus TaxID=1844 RepID=A0ABQ5SSR4_9ACTN|nr:leucyl aminopeptidase [Nocardioides luteus]MDR7311159.1 leucyl aminopeptidase [Nocardioides luteus]GGR62683.1 putative cytosol aminopeptidase [Nocardioides luteus]GLJ66705.1 putative cytosol aminopeptidase [Nocardioides luteus]
MTLPDIAYTLRTASPAKTRAEAVVVGIGQGRKDVELATGAEDVKAAYGRRWRGLLATLGVTGKAGEVTRLPAGSELGAQLLVLAGLGKADADGNHSTDAVRRAAGAAARAVPNATSVAVALPADTPELVRAVTEGYLLGGYTYTAYKSGGDKKEDKGPSDVAFLSPIARRDDAVTAFEEAQVVAQAVAGTREWVNVPPADLTPPAFAEAITHVADLVDGVEATVLDEKQLAELGCGGILAVGMGSAAMPRLVELTYSPEDARGHIALVGKGITFDSGGLTIKPGGSMSTMKSDMAGAAAVAQATFAIARLGLPVKVSAFVPMAENMVSGSAYRPGDVVTHYGGKTVEVSNMDAEGRMILADALVRATEVSPDVILDVATLTGHMVMALGDKVSGVLGSEEIVDSVLAAAKVAGEQMWPMPIPEWMEERIRSSKVADLNQHDWIRWGGGLYAAAFLREFTNGLPWAHLDIAGPSFNSGGAAGHLTPGGTGVAVATLVDYVRNMATDQ